MIAAVLAFFVRWIEKTDPLDIVQSNSVHFQ